MGRPSRIYKLCRTGPGVARAPLADRRVQQPRFAHCVVRHHSVQRQIRRFGRMPPPSSAGSPCQTMAPRTPRTKPSASRRPTNGPFWLETITWSSWKRMAHEHGSSCANLEMEAIGRLAHRLPSTQVGLRRQAKRHRFPRGRSGLQAAFCRASPPQSIAYLIWARHRRRAHDQQAVAHRLAQPESRADRGAFGQEGGSISIRYSAAHHAVIRPRSSSQCALKGWGILHKRAGSSGG